MQGGGYGGGGGAYPPPYAGPSTTYPPPQGGGGYGGAAPSYGGAPPPYCGGAPPTYPPQYGGGGAPMPYYAAGGGAAPPPYGAAPYGGGPPQPYGGAPTTYGGPAAYGGMPAAQPPPSQGAPWGHDYYGMIQAQEMAELQRWFNTADRDRNGSISASELQQQQWSGNRFSASTCRSLVKVFDRKQSGEITFAEYAQLHKFVSSMEAAFRKFDRDRNGRLDKLEITNALREGGFHFNPATANTLMRKFATGGAATTGGSTTKRPAASATLNLESFIQLCAFLGSCRSTFQWTDTDRDGQIELTLAQFIGIAAAF